MKPREGPQDVDRLVGRQVRMLRLGRGLSQTELGMKLGVTFQQVQKNERGTNRISASKLHEIAQVLGVEVAQLFADTDPETLRGDADLPRRVDLLVAHALGRLPEGYVRQRLSDLIFALGGKDPVPISAAP